MKYKVEIYEDEDLGDLMIDVPKEIGFVVDLVLSDIQEDGSGTWLDAVDKVLSKQSTYEEVSGNACVMEVKEDVTKVVFKFAEEGELYYSLIETEELKKIFMHWDEAIEKKYGGSN
ncbi:hypothetical protein [Priestia koreensis]|uniref:hypothetical protein n=1 Tax=Priestia koreensis TaxID=284581 RepID=UPI001F5A7FFE|nr:hypothetical protein [Priestia koreensis]UNL83516.1 hypothetical protein IE339_15255 [Priestia koreensis]